MSTIQLIFSTPGSFTWTPPTGVTSVTVKLLGAGGDGQVGPGGQIGSGGGGGGGGYAEYDNVTVTPGVPLSGQVGLHGGGAQTPGSPLPADSWFKSSLLMFAMGGGNGPNALGGFQFAGSPSISHSGGNSSSTGDYIACPGGGGAAGPNGAGGLGAGVQLFPFGGGGGGGGGANGGADGQNSDFAFAAGGNGGNNRFGTGGGAGSSTVAPGGNGTAGGGGGGGLGSGPSSHSDGGNGSQDTIWGAFGPGGGGGGAGYSNGSGGNGGNGGGRGAGGGGANTGGIAGLGTSGLVIIEYPAPAAPPELYCVPFIVGVTYPSKCQILRPASPAESGTQSGPSQGKLRRMTHAMPLLHDTQGMSMGVDFLKMRALKFKSAGGTVPLTVQQLYSGVYWETVDADENYDNMWCWQVTRPYPCTVVSVECQLETKENL